MREEGDILRQADSPLSLEQPKTSTDWRCSCGPRCSAFPWRCSGVPVLRIAQEDLSESAWCERPPPPFTKRYLLFYCFYTPQKVIWELYYIGGVFFGASSFGRFGRRGKTPNVNTGVFTYTPCVTLSHQESVGASPVAIERNRHPCSLMRRRSWRGSRVVRGSPQR